MKLEPPFYLCSNCAKTLEAKYHDSIIGMWTDTCDHCDRKDQISDIFEDCSNVSEILKNHNNIMLKKTRRKKLNTIISEFKFELPNVKGYNKDEVKICFLIWGCVPLDHLWAKGSIKFKNAVKDWKDGKLKWDE